MRFSVIKMPNFELWYFWAILIRVVTQKAITYIIHFVQAQFYLNTSNYMAMCSPCDLELQYQYGHFMLQVLRKASFSTLLEFFRECSTYIMRISNQQCLHFFLSSTFSIRSLLLQLLQALHFSSSLTFSSAFFYSFSNCCYTQKLLFKFSKNWLNVLVSYIHIFKFWKKNKKVIYSSGIFFRLDS